MLWTVLLVAYLAWMFAAIFENGVTWAGVLILALTMWALLDLASSSG